MLSELIERKISDLPDKSGVYVMLDESNTIIYVGKAVNLKNRVKQYFYVSGNKNEKVAAMVSKIFDFYYIITNSEQDALVLEANLIKKHRPVFNILLKDDKYFPYIKIDITEKYPRLQIVRKVLKDNAKYFGPFMGGVSVKEIVSIITSAYAIRTCSLNLETKRNKRACLNYHIKRCMAPCINNITEKDYSLILSKAISFLKGNDDEIEKLFKNKMLKYSENEEFEFALEMKKSLEMLQKLKLKKIATLSKNINIDIYAIVSNGKYSAVSVLYIRDGRMVGADNASLNDASLDDYDTLRAYLFQVYEKSVFYPDEIIISTNIPESAELEKLIEKNSGKKINIICPQKGIRHQLCIMAENNASDYLEKSIEKLKHSEELTQGACEQLCRILNLKGCRRIECYDISNISGTDKVASMAVMIDGVCTNSLYRRFKIKTVEGADDYASLHEALNRRLAKFTDTDISFSDKPNLIVIDGGLGQLNAVREIISINGIPVISIAKKNEEIYTTYSNEPIKLLKSNLALRMIQRIRDEAHRFAVSYHRTLRDKRNMSILEEIENIGPKKRAKLFKHFKSLQNIKDASIEELIEADITNADANTIKNFFKEDN